MYYYEQDQQPGDTNGQGVGGVWWATTPTGKKAAGTGSNTGSGGGYSPARKTKARRRRGSVGARETSAPSPCPPGCGEEM